jgi:hypothetical protein
MGKTLIADGFTRVLWTSEDYLSTNDRLNIVNSSIVQGSAKIAGLIANADFGTKVLIPFVKGFEWSPANISNDSDTIAAVNKMEKVQGSAVVTMLNQGWGESDISRIVTSGQDTIEFARNEYSGYFNKEIQARMLALLDGAIASNKANEGSDNVLVDKVNPFSYDLAVDTLGLCGDHGDTFNTVIMHSSTVRLIKKTDITALTTVMDKDLGKEVMLYNGMKVIQNDNMTIVPDAVDGDRVTTIFIKDGAFVFEPVNAQVPFEVERDASTGNGGGATNIWTRMGFLLNINGYSFDGTVADVSPSIPELSDPTAQTRLVDAKLAPFVALESLKV